jgi:hypothetical protein
MTEDELRSWLSEAEWSAIVDVPISYRGCGNPGDVVHLAEQLGRSREALDSACKRAFSQERECPVCERLEYEGHTATCVVASIRAPR